MENASKALLIAAEVMVGVLLLSLMAALFFLFDNYQQKTQENINLKEVYEFNTKFQVYEDKELTAQDVLTIVNMVKDYNEKYGQGTIKITTKPIKVENNEKFLNPEKPISYKMTITERTAGRITGIGLSKN